MFAYELGRMIILVVPILAYMAVLDRIDREAESNWIKYRINEPAPRLSPPTLLKRLAIGLAILMFSGWLAGI